MKWLFTAYRTQEGDVRLSKTSTVTGKTYIVGDFATNNMMYAHCIATGCCDVKKIKRCRIEG